MVEHIFEIEVADIGHHHPGFLETPPAMGVEIGIELRWRQRRLPEHQRLAISMKALSGPLDARFHIAVIRGIEQIDRIEALGRMAGGQPDLPTAVILNGCSRPALKPTASSLRTIASSCITVSGLSVIGLPHRDGQLR